MFMSESLQHSDHADCMQCFPGVHLQNLVLMIDVVKKFINAQLLDEMFSFFN